LEELTKLKGLLDAGVALHVEHSPSAIPARTTDGCAPTATTYAAIAARAPSSANSRETQSTQATARTLPATSATFWPETASR
jgi:hypothetical protein